MARFLSEKITELSENKVLYTKTEQDGDVIRLRICIDKEEGRTEVGTVVYPILDDYVGVKALMEASAVQIHRAIELAMEN